METLRDEGRMTRIYALSDLHADFPANRRRILRLPAGEHTGDALLVAGDVADGMDVLRDVLGFLRTRFRDVFFVPGNHELWVRGDPRTSVEKFFAVLELCDELGVRTRPARVDGTWVVPLFAWYHESFDTAGEGVADELEAWADRYFCRWTAEIGRVDEFFLRMNARSVRRYEGPVVSFSHFVPRTELVPPVEYLRFKGLPLVAGTTELDRQLRALGSAVHVYGHTHIAGDRTIDGVRYVQHWLRRGTGEEGEGPPPLKLVWTAGTAPSDTAAPLFC